MEKLITCKSCGNGMSKEAKTCPHCGKNNKKSKVGLLIFIGLIIAILFFFRFHIFNLLSSSEIMQEFGVTESFSIEKYLFSCQEYDYFQLKDNPDFFMGKDTFFVGRIEEINGRIIKLHKKSDALIPHTIFVEYKPFVNSFESFEKGDTVKVYGVCNGVFKRKVLFGYNDPPLIIGRYIVYEN
jgi:hypothetical protein